MKFFRKHLKIEANEDITTLKQKKFSRLFSAFFSFLFFFIAKGTDLARTAGKEDPVELDSRL